MVLIPPITSRPRGLPFLTIVIMVYLFATMGHVVGDLNEDDDDVEPLGAPL